MCVAEPGIPRLVGDIRVLLRKAAGILLVLNVPRVAPPKEILLREVVIDANAILIQRQGLWAIVAVVETCNSRSDGLRNDRLRPSLRRPIDAAGRDAIARKWIAQLLVGIRGVGARREGIVDHAAQSAKIAAELLGRRDQGESGSNVLPPISLVREKEECLIPLHWSAQRGAELVLAQRRLLSSEKAFG